MTSVTTIANKLHKDREYILGLLDCYNIEPSYDAEGEWVRDDEAEKLLNQEVSEPTRYNKRNGVECLDITDTLSGDNNVQYFYLGCIMKYLYRRLNVTDLKKARTYLDKWIENAEKRGVIK